MKYEEKFKDFVVKWLNEYRYDVFGGEYKYDIEFVKEDKDFGDKKANADIIVEDTYLYLEIKIYPNLYEYWKQKDYKQVKEDLLHEMCHILTNPIRDLAHNLLDGFLETKNNIRIINERQTQRISNSIMRLNDIIDEKNKEIKELKKKLKKKK